MQSTKIRWWKGRTDIREMARKLQVIDHLFCDVGIAFHSEA
jgi:hypothetical protein